MFGVLALLGGGGGGGGWGVAVAKCLDTVLSPLLLLLALQLSLSHVLKRCCEKSGLPR